jgi:hypothetical protein
VKPVWGGGIGTGRISHLANSLGPSNNGRNGFREHYSLCASIFEVTNAFSGLRTRIAWDFKAFQPDLLFTPEELSDGWVRIMSDSGPFRIRFSEMTPPDSLQRTAAPIALDQVFGRHSIVSAPILGGLRHHYCRI